MIKKRKTQTRQVFNPDTKQVVKCSGSVLEISCHKFSDDLAIGYDEKSKLFFIIHCKTGMKIRYNKHGCQTFNEAIKVCNQLSLSGIKWSEVTEKIPVPTQLVKLFSTTRNKV